MRLLFVVVLLLSFASCLSAQQAAPEYDLKNTRLQAGKVNGLFVNAWVRV
jgi:hypothetical protein